MNTLNIFRNREQPIVKEQPVNFFRKKQGGFTLIELMIAIAILGLIGAAGFVVFKFQMPKVRDAKRIDDVQRLSTVFGLYGVDNGVTSLYGTGGLCSEWSGWESTGLLDVWICSSYGSLGLVFSHPAMVDAFKDYGGLPVDPLNTSIGSRTYDYRVWVDGRAEFCCTPTATGVVDSGCASKHKEWIYITAVSERSSFNVNKVDPGCVAGSAVQNFYDTNRYLLMSVEPQSIFD